MTDAILIIPVAPADEPLYRAVVPEVESIFKIPVAYAPEESIDPAFSFDYSRNQYNSTLILTALIRKELPASKKLIGVAMVDLFVPVLTYVFGEAQLDGQAAVVSQYRLDEVLYGMPPDQPLLHERFVKEIVHELGHTFGLVHCRNSECVMRSSTAVEEIDLKSKLFCNDCASRLKGK